MRGKKQSESLPSRSCKYLVPFRFRKGGDNHCEEQREDKQDPANAQSTRSYRTFHSRKVEQQPHWND